MAGRIDIGIDGGGTGCRVAISVDGGAVTETRGGSANIVTDPAGAEAAIREALMAALAGTASPSTTWDGPRLRRSGGRAPARHRRRLRHPPALPRLRGRRQRDGAGGRAWRSRRHARQPRHRVLLHPQVARGHRHVGGWGFHLGDEGSAAWLGRRALSLALRVADGRLPPDPLAEALIAAAPPHPVLFARDASPGDFAQIARLVPEHADTPGQTPDRARSWPR
jgi:glucosamine kinase